MLVRFSASNYRSIRERQELSLVASGLSNPASRAIETPAVRVGVLRVAGIYGANASGKTNVLRALQFAATAVKDSHAVWPPDRPVPRIAFGLDPAADDEPSTFDVEFVLDGCLYQYGFSLAAETVLGEWLYAFPKVRKQLWFQRGPGRFEFGKKLTGENRTIERTTRPNGLFLSAAAQNNHPLLTPIYNWFSSRLRFVTDDRRPMSTLVACRDARVKARVEEMLLSADLGLTGFETREEPIDEGLRKAYAALQAALPSAGEQLNTPDRIEQVGFLHRVSGAEPVKLGQRAESQGTIAFFNLLGPIIQALAGGDTLLVDELDASLHPLVAIDIVRLFNDPERNPGGAQLIFNTHDTNLLDTEILGRDQIWFTEKDSAGATHLYPLTDFKPRGGENVQRGYLQGRYGAVPFLGGQAMLAQPAKG